MDASTYESGQPTLLQGSPIPDALYFDNVGFDDAEKAMAELVELAKSRSKTLNEATTRRVLIDKLLFGCLGWRDDEVVSEDHVSATGYTDYTLSLPRPIVIVEAKREGVYFDLPLEESNTVRLGALLRKSGPLKVAVDQVSRYCQKKGVQFAIVTNGRQLIAFAAVRTDGTEPTEGRALIYSSLQNMLDDFTQVWNLLSRVGLLQQTLARHLLRPSAERIPPKPSSRIAGYPGVKDRNPIQADLKSVSELVLEDITRSRELEPRFLRECYCSNGALSQYSLLGKSILKTRYAALTDISNPGPATVDVTRDHVTGSILSESFARRPVLLIGDVGVGKTTFVKHLLDLEDKEILDHAIVLYLDLGTRQSLTLNIREAILSDLAQQLLEKYSIDIQEDSFVRGVYHGDLRRFATSINKSIRESDPKEYKKREVKFLDSQLSARDEHLKRSLEHLYSGRNKQNVIILDNCDQRNADDQQQAFLIAQEMASNWPALVFLSLRPETFHASRKRGALTGYHPKAFTIGPPRIDEVVEKRLNFALKITSGQLPVSTVAGGFTVRLEKLEALIKAFKSSLRLNPELLECIENISGSNVRLALDLIREFFGSGHVATGKIILIFMEEGRYIVPLHEFMRAILFGDNVFFDPSKSRIVNVFDVGSADPKEHFLILFALSLISTLSNSNSENGFVKTDQIYEGLQSLGFTAVQIDGALLRCISRKLIETVARQIPEPGGVTSPMLRLTSTGAYHLFRLCRSFVYNDAVLVDTPMFDLGLAARLVETSDLEARAERTKLFTSYLSEKWREANFDRSWFNWLEVADAVNDAVNRILAARHRRNQTVTKQS
jgi:hypothetical protein